MPGVACYDLKSLDYCIIPPKRKAFFNIGLAFKMEKGWTVQIHNRSGLSLIENIVIPGTPKIIDSDYYGNVIICLQNRNVQLYGEKKGQNCTDVPSAHLFN